MKSIIIEMVNNYNFKIISIFIESILSLAAASQNIESGPQGLPISIEEIICDKSQL